MKFKRDQRKKLNHQRSSSSTICSAKIESNSQGIMEKPFSHINYSKIKESLKPCIQADIPYNEQMKPIDDPVTEQEKAISAQGIIQKP